MKTDVISVNDVPGIGIVSDVDDELRMLIEKARLLPDGKALKVKYTSKKMNKYWMLNSWNKRLGKRIRVIKRGGYVYLVKKSSLAHSDIQVDTSAEKAERIKRADEILLAASKLLPTGEKDSITQVEIPLRLFYTIRSRVSRMKLPYCLSYSGGNLTISMKIGRKHETKYVSEHHPEATNEVR